MPRHVNEAGLTLVKAFEGLRLEAYLCPADVWTIGYGHTGPDVEPGMTITEQEAERLLRHDLTRFEAVIERSVTVALTNNQFDALASFVFNVGGRAFRRSTLRKHLNAGRHIDVPEQFLRWTKANRRTLPGLVRRRMAEAALWLDRRLDPL